MDVEARAASGWPRRRRLSAACVWDQAGSIYRRFVLTGSRDLLANANRALQFGAVPLYLHALNLVTLEGRPMRAETQKLVQSIREALVLLRRHL